MVAQASKSLRPWRHADKIQRMSNYLLSTGPGASSFVCMQRAFPSSGDCANTRIAAYRHVSVYRAVSDTGTATCVPYRWYVAWGQTSVLYRHCIWSGFLSGVWYYGGLVVAILTNCSLVLGGRYMHKHNGRFFHVKAVLVIVIHIVDKPNCCWPWISGGLWY